MVVHIYFQSRNTWENNFYSIIALHIFKECRCNIILKIPKWDSYDKLPSISFMHAMIHRLYDNSFTQFEVAIKKRKMEKKERLIQKKLFEAEIRLMNVHYNYLLYYFFAANILLLYGFPKGNGTDLRDYLWRLIVILGNFEKKSFLGSILRHNIRWLISNTFKWLKVRLYQISDGTGCISH